MQDSAPSQHAKATQNFLPDNMPDVISSQEWTPHSPDLNPLNYFFRISCKNLSTKEGVRISKIFRMLSETNGTMSMTSQKSYIAVGKAFSSCGKAEWRTYSAHFLLIS